MTWRTTAIRYVCDNPTRLELVENRVLLGWVEQDGASWSAWVTTGPVRRIAVTGTKEMAQQLVEQWARQSWR